MSRPVGFIGLGAMGGGVVRRLLAAGHDVVGWNRTKEKAAALLGEGMRWAGSPREATAAGEVVLTMLTDAAALEGVAGEIVTGLAPGGIWVDLSTIALDQSRMLAARVPAGAAFLDAPVSGSLTTLAQGQLSIMVTASPVRRNARALGASRTHWRPIHVSESRRFSGRRTPSC